MNGVGFRGATAQVGPRLRRLRRRTWVGLGALLLSGLLVWVSLALLSWFIGQVQDWLAAAPGVTAAVAAERPAERGAPRAWEQVGAVPVALRPEDRPRRDVSGTNIAPVPRYPGLARTYWHREGRQLFVHYEGRADYAAVLSHYVQGFAALGYSQHLQSATPAAKTHVWTKGTHRYLTKIIGKPKGLVEVQIETRLE